MKRITNKNYEKEDYPELEKVCNLFAQMSMKLGTLEDIEEWCDKGLYVNMGSGCIYCKWVFTDFKQLGIKSDRDTFWFNFDDYGTKFALTKEELGFI